uniref:Thymidylate synthase/dCMP hydroxymethylase domain-containing protein n=1 Tax=Ditylum brightwellii TaxID=49249 RepID=A0A7S4VU00_9STRA
MASKEEEEDDNNKTKIQCAPSNNLNVGFPHFPTAKEMYTHLRSITKAGGEFVVRNFVGVIEDISPDASLVETELFPRGALEYYTKKNMGWDYSQEEADMWQLAERGGAQGDYREGMQKKIANVIDCLKTEPLSKRAVIPIPFNSEGSQEVDWKDQGQNKCCRELHLYLEDGKLKCTGIVRMQNANIYVKNIHFFATLLDYVAKELGVELGEYTHWITNLCHDRTATCC